MKNILLLSALAIVLVGCTVSDDKFAATMRREGISQPRSTGYSFFGCSDDDSMHTGFTGVKNGVPVEGVICGQVIGLKGDTVRYR